MPWYTYVCEKCGETVQQKASLAYREVMPLHRGGGGCGDGRLKRLQPAVGPGGGPRGAAGRGAEPAKVGSAGAAAQPGADAGTGTARADRGPSPAAAPDPGRAWEDCVLEALSSIMAESASSPRRLELVPRLLATLPTLSLKLRFVESVARRGGAAAEVLALRDALAADVAAAPAEVLARERRLLELLLLATRQGKLGVEEIGRRLGDDRVMVRLLRSAIRWTAAEAGGAEEADPPFLAWAELRQVVGGPQLRSRILHLAGLPGAGDAWDRLVIEAAASADDEPRRAG